MAQIDIQRRRDVNWLWWIIGAIILALIVWWIIAASNNNQRVAGGDVAVPVAGDTTGTYGAPPRTAMTDTTPITSLGMLVSPTSGTSVIGRRVQLADVTVARTVGDHGFWIRTGSGMNRTDSDTAQVFVMRSGAMMPGMSSGQPMSDTSASRSRSSSMPQVKAGSRVRVTGTVMAMPTNLPSQSTEWKLPSADLSRLSAQGWYIQADSVTVMR